MRLVFVPILLCWICRQIKYGMDFLHTKPVAEGKKKRTPMIYEIKLKGHLDRRWIDQFYGMTMTHEEDGTTTLEGSLPDQTVLHTILVWIRDKNLRLISVNPTESCPEDESPADSQ